MQCVSSEEIVLADGYISMLERYIPKFRAANTSRRENIIEEAADQIKGTWTEDIEFDRDTIINVCELPPSCILRLLDIFSLFASICTAKSNGDRTNLHLMPENGRTVMFIPP